MMKQTKMLSTRVVVVLMVALLAIFAFGATVFAADSTYAVTFVLPDSEGSVTVENLTGTESMKDIIAANPALQDLYDFGSILTFEDGMDSLSLTIATLEAVENSDRVRLAQQASLMKKIAAIDNAKVSDYFKYYNTYIKESSVEDAVTVELYWGRQVSLYASVTESVEKYETLSASGFYPYGMELKDISDEAAVWLTYELRNDLPYLIQADEITTAGDGLYFPGYAIIFKAGNKIAHEGYFTFDSWDENGGVVFADTYADEPRVPNKQGYYGEWQNYTLAAEDIVVEAEYRGRSYRVYYDANGGEGEISSEYHIYGRKQSLSGNVFTRTGYTFAGWNTAADGSGDSYKDGEIVENLTLLSKVTLYAQWTKNAPEIYTATFLAEDGSVVATVEFEAGATELTNVPAVPEKIGYEGEWDSYVLEEKDITIRATYTAKSYEIKYDANGGEGNATKQTAKFDESVTLEANVFTKDGYTFAGWNTMSDGTGIHFDAGDSVTNLTAEGVITLYAEWEKVIETEETTGVIEETPEVPNDDNKSNLPLSIGVSVVGGLAVIGGVVGYLLYKKKKLS